MSEPDSKNQDGKEAGSAEAAGTTEAKETQGADDKDQKIRDLMDESAKRRLHQRDLEGKLETFQKQEEEANRKKMEEEGKYKEILTDKDKQIEVLNGTVKGMQLSGALHAEAMKQGISDMDYLKLIPSDVANSVTIADGKVTGADEAVKWLIENKPNVVSDNASHSDVPRNRPGAGGADGMNRLNPELFTKDGRLKQSALTRATQDPKFLDEHDALIKEYTKLNKIAPGV